MRKFISLAIHGLMVILFFSCATKPYMPLSDVPNAKVIGELEVKFVSSYGLSTMNPNSNELARQSGRAIGSGNSGTARAGAIGAAFLLGAAAIKDIGNAVKRRQINEAAYAALLDEARKRYTENIDIRNVTFSFIQYNMETGQYEYNGYGKVVVLTRDMQPSEIVTIAAQDQIFLTNGGMFYATIISETPSGIRYTYPDRYGDMVFTLHISSIESIRYANERNFTDNQASSSIREDQRRSF